MTHLVNITIYLTIYLSIPAAIRFIILRRPVKRKWVAIVILLPLFFIFSAALSLQRTAAQNEIRRSAGLPQKTHSNSFGSPLLYSAMVANYYILRRKLSQKADAGAPEIRPIDVGITRICPACRLQILPEARFCHRCGARIIP